MTCDRLDAISWWTQSEQQRVEEIAAGLSKADGKALLGAKLSDCHEWWLCEPVSDARLAGSDLVLTALGLAVRAHLQEQAS